MSLIVFLLIIALFLIVIALMQPVAMRLNLPLTVVLAVVGILIGAGATFLLRTQLTDAFDEFAASILLLPIGSEAFLYVFLPTLLFQTALTIEVRRLLDDWVPILVMAVLAVVIATLVIGLALAPFGVQPLVICLVVASIVATTDPSAVVGIFRDISAPGRLGRLIEGESLLNDAAAINLFTVFMTLAVTATQVEPVPVIFNFTVTLPGGALLGYAAARITILLLAVVRDNRMAEMSISLALPYVVYIAAEQVVGVSGVVAVVFAGLALNFHGPARLKPDNWTYLTATWDQLAYWAGTLIFVLAAILVPRILGDVTWAEIGLIGVVIVAALVARALVLFGVLPLLTWARLSPSVGVPVKLVVMWGGLRGSVTLALALSVIEGQMLPPDAQRFVAVLATGFVIFTLLIQGTTLRLMIRYLGVDQLSPLDAALRKQVLSLALQNVREAMAETASDCRLDAEIARSEAERFGGRLEAAVRGADKSEPILDRDRITLGLVTLAARERDLILDRFRQRLISAGMVDRMLSDASRLIDRTRNADRTGKGGRTEYRRAANRALAFSAGFRLAQMLQYRLGISGPLQRQIADRFELLVNTRIIVTELHPFIDRRILQILDHRVSDLLHEILTTREEQIEEALEALRLQYPGYAEELERRFLRKTGLRREEREYDLLFSDRLIGPELYRSLRRGLAASRRQEDARPPLDTAIHNRDLVRQLPLFRDLDNEAIEALAAALVPEFAAPGDILIREGDRADAVYFIARGAVEVDVPGQAVRLGRGDIFGELGVLGRHPRTAQVKAISYSTLMRLDEQHFLALLENNSLLREHVEKLVAERKRRS